MENRMQSDLKICSKWNHLMHVSKTISRNPSTFVSRSDAGMRRSLSPRTPSPLSLLVNTLVPCVHAASEPTVPSDSGGASENTTLDRLKTIQKPKIVVTDQEITSYLSNETGADRLRKMFGGDPVRPQSWSTEMDFVLHTAASSSCLIFFLTYFRGARDAFERFEIGHRTVKWETRFKAVRAATDAQVIGGIKFGARWAFKTFVFSSIFLTMSQSLAVYRNKSSPFEYIISGVLTGAFLRMHMGLKGMAGAGFTGGVLGTIFGMLMYGSLYFGSQTQEKRHRFEIMEKIREQKQVEELMSGSSQENLDNIPATKLAE